MPHPSFHLHLATAVSKAAHTRRTALETALAAALGGMTSEVVTPAASIAKRKKRRNKQKSALKTAYLCAGPGGSEENIEGTERYGQVFAAATSGSLRQVRLAIGKGSGSTPGNFVVQLLETSGSPAIPDPGPLAVLAAVTIPEAVVPEDVGTVVANFAGTPLVAGTEYAVVVSRPDSDVFRVGYHLNPAACPGTVASNSGRDLFSLFDQLDFAVSVLVS